MPFTFCTPTDFSSFLFLVFNRFKLDHNRHLVNCESCNRSFLIAVFGMLTSSMISFRIAQRTQSGSVVRISGWRGDIINSLNPELNPICYLLALLAHHFLRVTRIMVKSLTLRLLMSYIYIWNTYS